MTATDLVRRITQGEVSVEDVVQTSLAKAERVQKDLNAFISIMHEPALARARELDRAHSQGTIAGPLAGVPVVIKDNICVKGVKATAGSKSLASFVAPYSATVVERLEAAGAVIVAKANLDEFGMGSSNENSAFGAAKNPWDKARVPGGSSGGSAIAIATGIAPIALGTDTGGSVRQPASFNGVIGFKPTYGCLSRFGVIAFASSLDQVGVLGRTSKDISLTMHVMTGHDPMDATSLREKLPNFGFLSDSSDLHGLKIGMVKELCAKGNSPAVLEMLAQTKAQLEQLGATVGEVSLPHAPYGISTYYLVAPAEASANLARYDGMIYSSRSGEHARGQAEVMMHSRAEGFGSEVRRRILMGTYALSSGYYDAYYGKALKVRRLIANDFEAAFKDYDFIMSPTSPTAAYPLGEKMDDPLAMYLDDIDTVLANLVGLPAISLPLGHDHGLPCGVQFLAPALADASLVELAGVLERSTETWSPLAADYA